MISKLTIQKGFTGNKPILYPIDGAVFLCYETPDRFGFLRLHLLQNAIAHSVDDLLFKVISVIKGKVIMSFEIVMLFTLRIFAFNLVKVWNLDKVKSVF